MDYRCCVPVISAHIFSLIIKNIKDKRTVSLSCFFSLFSDHARSCSSDLRTDFKPTFDNQEDFFDTSAGPVTQPRGHKTSPPVSDEDMPSSPLPDPPPLSPPSALKTPQRSPVAPPAPILVPQTLDKDKNKVRNQLSWLEAA